MVLAAGSLKGNAEASGGVGGYRPEAPLVARVAGLPASVLGELRLEESWEYLGELLDLDRRLAMESEALTEALFQAIGNLSESRVKPRVVALRRAIHQVRTPAKGEWNDEVAAVLPAEIADGVKQWLSRLRDRDQRRAVLPRLLSDELARKQRLLRRAVADPLFQHGLSQASPALFEEVRKWLADGRRRPKRRTLTGLARFLARVAAKTSPYSTFMTSVVGSWTAHGPAVRFAGDLETRRVLELDRRVVARLVRTLIRLPGLAACLPVRLNPSTLVTGGTASFLGPRPDEPIITLPVSTALEECLRVAGRDGDRTVAELCALLASDTGADPAHISGFLDRLLEIGLLEHRSPVADQSERPLDELLAWLGSADPADTDRGEVTALIDRLRGELRRPIDLADIEDHCARQDALAHTVNALETSLGLPRSSTDQLRKTVFHESSLFPRARLECSLPRWRPALDDLDVVRRWLAPHDGMLPMRLVLPTYVSSRFGEGAAVPFVSLYRAIQEDLARPEEQCEPWLAVLRPFLQLTTPVWPTQLEHCPVPRLRELYRLWRESVEAVLRVPQGGGVIRVDPDVLAERAAGWPSWVRPAGSVTCYLQPYLVDDEPRLVINMMAGGYGRGRSRWLRLAAQAGAGEPGEPPSRAHSTDPVVAELSGTFDASMNLRTPFAPFEIDYPFTTSDRPAGQRIPLCDLTVQHDVQADGLRLFSPGLGVHVQPVHLGMMGDPLLPPAARLLLAAFGPSRLVHPALPVVYPVEDVGPRSGPYHLPRIEVGRVTLQRARWFVSVDEVPARQAGVADADHLVRLIRWLRASGVPERCYVRVMERDADWRTQFFAKSRKPVFVDFANFFLVMTFEHLIKGRTGLVIFEEALPPPEGGCGPASADPHVTEFIVELSANEESYAKREIEAGGEPGTRRGATGAGRRGGGPATRTRGRAGE